MEKPRTPEQVKTLLEKYYDIPAMIAEEYATIQNCQNQMGVFSLPSVNISGMPGGKGMFSDCTANEVLRDQTAEYENEIHTCRRRIENLRLQRDWVREKLSTLDHIDERIVKLKYLGPSDPRKREKWRPPSFDDVGRKTGYSTARAKARAYSVLFRFCTK